jgi:ABC-type glycerol-3-phosphate transport system permease component
LSERELTATSARIAVAPGRLLRPETIVRTFFLVVLILGALIILVPFAWALSASLTPRELIFAFPPRWFPQPLRWDNYVQALTTLPFGRYALNTLLIIFFVEIGTLLSCSLVAFGFAHMEFPARNFLFVLMLGSMMVPEQVTIVPLYQLFRQIGWVNTYLPLIVPSFFGTPLYIFLLRQFFRALPRELNDAARIDGASWARVYWSIALPLARPGLAVIGVFTFLQAWTNFFYPLIFLHSSEQATLALGLAYYTGAPAQPWELIMPITVLMMLVPVVLFFFVQREFFSGLSPLRFFMQQ